MKKILLSLLFLISQPLIAMMSPSLIKIISDQNKTEQQIVNELKPILAKGVDVNKPSQDIPYFTPLMRAADLGYLKVTELLMDHGAQLNATDNLGSTALFYAARKGHLPIVELLLLNGADATMINKQGNTIVLDILRSYGANLDETKKPHSKLKPDTFRANIYEIIKRLVQNGADLNRQGSNQESRRTPIMWAAFFREWPLVQLLKDKGADLSLKDINGKGLDFYLPDAKNDPKVYNALSASDKKYLEQLRNDIKNYSLEYGWTRL